MSRSAGPARRSGDPRKRAAEASAPHSDAAPRRRVMVALAAAGCLALLAFVLLRAGDQEQDHPGLEHAEVACDFTSKAAEAAGVETDARVAAAVLLLDQAIIASARAADTDPDFADLDDAVQAVHTAGHRGDPGQWHVALDTALSACRTSTE